MTTVTFPEDCGNSPRNLLLRDFNIAAAKGDLSFVERHLAEDVTWCLFEPAGQKTIHGREKVLDELKNNLVIEPVEFAIETVITHGKHGAVNGTIKATDGKTYVFCDVYTLSGHGKSDAITKMTSYIIENQQLNVGTA